MLENPIAPEGGFIRVPEESGFGMRIKPEVWNHPAAVRQVSGRS
jgi:L-alanine-DL-glutamate epimerase-like enolase superfamily enzyme